MTTENKQIIDDAAKFNIGSEWAITENGLVEVRANFQKLPELIAALENPKSLEAYRADYLDNTRNVTVRDGVAIIPITGAIFLNFNWYMYFYGGTCLQFLMKDIQAAVDNPNVFAVCFKINSPGGEVLGTNETAKYIYSLRAKNVPMISYVEGMMCSAALWLGVQAGEVVVDETSYCGSIGICTSYLDDSKFLNDLGFKEIDIISSQSPYKNMPPTTDAGLKRIQSRLDYIAKIFGDAVALARDVTTEKVFKDFGQGDVLIGQQAVDAGLADRIASQEEVLTQLTKTHAPQLYRGDDGAETLPTLNFQEKVESDSVEEESLVPAAGAETQKENSDNSILNKEELMSNEKEKTAAGAENNNGVVSAEVFADMRKQLEAANTKLDAEAKARQEAEAKAAKQTLTAKMTGIAADFAGDPAKKTEFLVTLAEKFGEDSAEVAGYIEDQKAAAAQLRAGGLFKESGSAGSETNAGTAAEKLAAETKKIIAEQKLSYAEACVLAAETHPELYAAYEQEMAEK